MCQSMNFICTYTLVFHIRLKRDLLRDASVSLDQQGETKFINCNMPNILAWSFNHVCTVNLTYIKSFESTGILWRNCDWKRCSCNLFAAFIARNHAGVNNFRALGQTWWFGWRCVFLAHVIVRFSKTTVAHFSRGGALSPKLMARWTSWWSRLGNHS